MAQSVDRESETNDPARPAEWSAPPPLLGGSLDGFERVEQIGHGGSGAVFKAYDPWRGRTVAIKILGALPSMAGPDGPVASASALIQLSHPSIVATFEVFRQGGRTYAIRESVPGTTLEERLHSARPLAPCEAARLVFQLADALQHGHERGVIHGDVTSGKVLIGDDGRPRLTDFGLIQFQDQGHGVNLHFGAPELIEDASQPNVRTDIYSLGVILYQLLTGVPPYRGGIKKMIEEILRGAARPPRALNPQLPRDLEVICLKAMASNPAARYASAGEFAEDLRRFLASSPETSGSLGWIRRWLGSQRPFYPTGSDPNPDSPGLGPDQREDFWK